MYDTEKLVGKSCFVAMIPPTQCVVFTLEGSKQTGGLRNAPCFSHAVIRVPLYYLLVTAHFGIVVLVAQSCLTRCDPMDRSPRGPSVHGISQAGILEWVAISFSRESSRPRDQTCISCIEGRFFPAEPWWKPQFGTGKDKVTQTLESTRILQKWQGGISKQVRFLQSIQFYEFSPEIKMCAMRFNK